ncbi:MAG: DUF6291 domain-containing protein [Clostridium sp.]|nr:DUF6291 domain-containing protein [Clostridium sp.]
MANKNIKAFSFYKSYYEALKEIPEKDKKDIIFAMINYVFEDKKPKLKGINKVIWALIEPNLDKSKNKSNGNSGAPIGNQNASKTLENKGNNDTIKKQSKNNQNSIKNQSLPHDISYSYSYINNSLSYIIFNNSNNKELIYNLFKEYIKLREDNKYNISETIINRLVKKLNEYGKTDEDKIEIISQAINGEWKDFYKLKNNDESKSNRRVL